MFREHSHPAYPSYGKQNPQKQNRAHQLTVLRTLRLIMPILNGVNLKTADGHARMPAFSSTSDVQRLGNEEVVSFVNYVSKTLMSIRSTDACLFRAAEKRRSNCLGSALAGAFVRQQQNKIRQEEIQCDHDHQRL